jgi:phospholipid/cholesterol/gamma-HCH transport system permease protein
MSILEGIGNGVIEPLAYVGELSMQFWSSVLTIPRVLPVLGKRGRWLAAIRQMAQIGVDALPMIAMVSMSAGFIFAMQSGNELRRFGALALVIQIIAIGFTRELGPLLTAIVVSSRSGSAFSAEIGTMVVTNEIDVLETMGLSPIEYVLAPKYVAALIVVPCLVVMSDLFGVLAGGAFMLLSTKMTFLMYLRAAADSVVMRDIVAGFIKSLAFATIVVHVGCLEGFKTWGGPEAVGRSTTSAVVKSTLLVILTDAVFTAFFYVTKYD